MILVQAKKQQIFKILRESFEIWGDGLSFKHYLRFNYQLFNLAWAKNHYKFYVLASQNGVLAGFKLYSLKLNIQGRIFRIAGLGAIYVKKGFRQKGLGHQIIDLAIKHLASKKYDGIVLFSDIASQFYTRHGFKVINQDDYIIDLDKDKIIDHLKNTSQTPQKAINISEILLDRKWAKILCTIYHKNYKLGHNLIRRCRHYLSFKLFKEHYALKHAKTKSPVINFLIDIQNSSYIIFSSQKHQKLRILEVCGYNLIGLMTSLYYYCFKKNIYTIELFKPSPKLEEILGQFSQNTYLKKRDWGKFMLLSLHEKLARLTLGKNTENQIYIHEFDYF